MLFVGFEDLITKTAFKSGDSDKWNYGTDLKLMPKVGFPKEIGDPIQIFGFFFGFYGNQKAIWTAFF